MGGGGLSWKGWGFAGVGWGNGTMGQRPTPDGAGFGWVRDPGIRIGGGVGVGVFNTILGGS